MANEAPITLDRLLDERLAGLAAELREEYLAARPWPHVVVADLLPVDALEAVVDEIRDLDPDEMEQSSSRRHVKRELSDVSRSGPATRRVLDLLDSDAFVRFLSDLTGVPGLVPDPDHIGAGIHETPPGGYTMIHVDFPAHPVTRLHHRVNVLLYLNQDWEDDWGGHLELWPHHMRAMGRRVRPSFNSTVIFATDASTFHGLPEPVACPPGRSRISLAAYYYSPHPQPRRRIRLSTYRGRPQDAWWVSLPLPRDLVHAAVPAPTRHVLKQAARRALGRRPRTAG